MRTLRLRARAFTGGTDGSWLLLLWGLALVEEVDRVAFGVYAPEIRDTFGVSDGTYLGIVNAATAVPVLAALPLARIADRSGRVRIAWCAALVWTGLSVLTGSAGSKSDRVALQTSDIGAVRWPLPSEHRGFRGERDTLRSGTIGDDTISSVQIS